MVKDRKCGKRGPPALSQTNAIRNRERTGEKQGTKKGVEEGIDNGSGSFSVPDGAFQFWLDTGSRLMTVSRRFYAKQPVNRHIENDLLDEKRRN